MAVVSVSPDRASPLLAVRGLAVSFGPLRALDQVDLSVRAGELVALAGENGAGKTTLVRCIAGDIVPSSGEIRLADRPVPAHPAAVIRRGVAVVWQDLALCDNLDIAANLFLGREPAGLLLSETRFHTAAAALLESLNIALPDTTRGVRSLSGGQRQLLAVARAMGDKPKLLVLDEPTASLGVNESRQVEELITGLRRRDTTILLVSHDIEQMFRLADRIVVLRHGRVVGDVDPSVTHPDDVAALVSGQEVDSSARHQLTRLHGLADRLASADPSSSQLLILSALGAALGTERLCTHLVEGHTLMCAASVGITPALASAWSRLPFGPGGGPVGQAADTREPVLDDSVRFSPSWAPFRGLARAARVESSCAVPVMGRNGLLGVITVFRPVTGKPQRDELDLITLYAGYAAGAVERERLLAEVTARNRVLETIREMLQTLAGPVPVAEGIVVALDSVRQGLQADEVALLNQARPGEAHCRAVSGGPGSGGLSSGGLNSSGLSSGGLSSGGPDGSGGSGRGVASSAMLGTADHLLATDRRDGRARLQRGVNGQQYLAVTFTAPGGPTALIARWESQSPTEDGPALMEDAANSLRLALEREEAALAREEAAALRRSQDLQRGFLSRLSHELRTPLTAIRGYASSLMQPDVTWDGDSQQRFLDRIVAESARLGRLVGDLLDFSAIESGILRLQPDWCDIRLVLEAAAACLPPSSAGVVEIACDPALPAVWADHDRLEQVFLNLMDNALRHNPVGTRVRVGAAEGPSGVTISVLDDGTGMPAELAAAPFEPWRRRTPTAGPGLGLSITKGIVEAHGGRLELARGTEGTQFRVHLPAEAPGGTGSDADEHAGGPESADGPDAARSAGLARGADGAGGADGQAGGADGQASGAGGRAGGLVGARGRAGLRARGVGRAGPAQERSR